MAGPALAAAFKLSNCLYTLGFEAQLLRLHLKTAFLMSPIT